MNTTEVNVPVPSAQIKGFTHETVQGERAQLKRSPFKDGHIPQFSVVGIENKDTHPGVAFDTSILRKVSADHGRSYEFTTGRKNTLIWADEYGNVFTSIVTKGNNATNLTVFAAGNSPSGFIFNGLQDGYSMVRVLRASEILRSRQVGTEAIIKAIEPAELPYQGEMLPLAEFKKRLIETIWEENAEDRPDPGHNWPRVSRMQIPRIVQALNDTTFFITARAHQIPERLSDLLHYKFNHIHEELIQRAMSFAILEGNVQIKSGQLEGQVFINKLDIFLDNYLIRYLPRRTAQNIAKMHKAGLIHKYLHTGNISFVGSIYDLDSVMGEPLGLGDPEITDEDRVYDVKQFINGHGTYLSAEQVLSRSGIRRAEKFTVNFLKQYIQDMGWEGQISKFPQINDLIESHYSDEDDNGLLEYYTHLLVMKHRLYSPNNPSAFAKVCLQRFLDLLEPNRLAKPDEIASSLYSKFLSESKTRGFNLETDIPGISLLSEVISQKIVTAFNNVRNNMSVNEILEMEQNDISKWAKFRSAFQKETIHQLGWDENLDITDFVEDIDRFLKTLSTRQRRSYRHHYATRLENDLGYRLELPDTVEEMIQLFYESDEDEALERIIRALSNRDRSFSREQVVNAALRRNEDNPYDADFTSNAFERYEASVGGLLYQIIEGEERERYDSWVVLFGEDKARTMVDWLTHRYIDKFALKLPIATIDRIEQEAQERINNLKKYVIILNEVEENGWGGDIENFKHVVELFNGFDDNAGFLNEFITKIVEKNNITYQYPIKFEEFISFALAKFPIEGGVLPGREDQDEQMKQMAVLGAHMLQDASDGLRDYLQENGITNQVSPEALDIFIEYYKKNLINNFNNFSSELDINDELIDQKKESYQRERTGRMKDFEIWYYKSLTYYWGWDQDISSNLDKIRKLFEDNGIPFEGTLEEEYLQLNNVPVGESIS